MTWTATMGFIRRSAPLFLAGVVPAYFLTNYFSILYDDSFSFILLCLFFQILGGIACWLLSKNGFFRFNWRTHWLTVLVLAAAASLPVSTLAISLQFPGLFNQRLVFVEPSLLPLFFGLAVLSTSFVIWLTSSLEKSAVTELHEDNWIIRFVRGNRAGIILAVLFFFVYFASAQSLNFPGRYTRDQYFEADISDWIVRLTAHPTEEQLPVRAVHPAVLLFLRPLVWLLSVPLNGDRLQAAFMLSAMAGSGSVFVTWLIVKRRTGNTNFSLLSASILGASASHLLLGSMLESYIFSAFALISFCFLMQSNRTSLNYSVPAGMLIFGITVTNLAQACILYFFKVLRIETILKFVTLVAAITLALHLVQTRLYPNSRLMTASSLARERIYSFDPFGPAWQTIGRINLTARAILLYGVVAPEPFILSEELGATTPNFRTYRMGIAELYVAGYKGLADITVKSWFLILLLAIIQFLANTFKSPRTMTFHLSLLFCLGFNIVLHVLYGDDPMLYSPNWVYALVLLVSASFEKWADNRWLQVGAIAFLALMMYTNLGLIHRIMSVSLPFYGR